MLSLLNAVSIFGLELDMDASTVMLYLLIFQSILIILEFIVLAILIKRISNKKEKVVRSLLGITLDLGCVKRNFKTGESFDCDGLVINANYNMPPNVKSITEYSLLTREKLKTLELRNAVPDCYVLTPDMSEEGKVAVTVVYCGQSLVYMISIEKEEEVNVPVVKVEDVKEPAERILKGVRTLVSLSLNTENARREYFAGEKFSAVGLVVKANYDLEPFTEIIKDYEIQPVDMNQIGLQNVLVTFGGQSISFQINIINVTPIVVEKRPEIGYIVVPEHKESEPAAPVGTEEESLESGTLRYDRSFTARLIQADDELKQWYTALKNDLLSYKKAKARMSWKRESYRFGRETVARLSFRGKTLCVCLPLDADEYIGTKYKVEEIEVAPDEEKLCIYRIKNAKRLKYAMELIAVVMERLGATKNENFISEDYYVQYEESLELINKGLIKRNIKSKEDEAIFEHNRQAGHGAVAEVAATKTTRKTSVEASAKNRTERNSKNRKRPTNR